MRKTTVHRHTRRTKKGRTTVKKHPRKIGSSWKGDKYIHGPRKHSPDKYSEFRLGKPTKEGKRMVFGKIKGTNKWEVQSELTPKNRQANYNAFDGAGLGDIMNEIARREKINKEIEKKAKELDKLSDGSNPEKQKQIVDEIRFLKMRRDI